MSHITYHYLLNKTNKSDVNNMMDLKGKYIYDLNHNPDKQKQEKIYKGYLDLFLRNSPPEDLVKLCMQQKGLKAQVNFWFESMYKENIEPVLGKPYFGVFGIYTTPANLLQKCYRVKIDLDTIDPDVVIIRFGKDIVKYSIPNWNKYCEPFVNNKDGAKEFKRTGSFKSLPSIIIYLPRLRYSPEDIEEYTP